MEPASCSTALVGILNLTPDSFSDGGRHAGVASALAHAAALIEDGADVIDVGAESTRPGAQAVEHAEEWSRLAPVLPDLAALCTSRRIPLSVDTRHWQVAEKSLRCGADWINDVTGLKDASMRRLIAEAGCRAVFMHALDVPVKPEHHLPEDIDVIDCLLKEAQRDMDALQQAGIDRTQLIYDPGIGFGKTTRQNLQILASAKSFASLGIPLLFGHSRKKFMQCFSSAPASERDEVTLACSAFLMMQGIDYLRVHALGKHATLRRVITGKT